MMWVADFYCFLFFARQLEALADDCQDDIVKEGFPLKHIPMLCELTVLQTKNVGVVVAQT
jgi:hypothetical protein